MKISIQAKYKFKKIGEQIANFFSGALLLILMLYYWETYHDDRLIIANIEVCGIQQISQIADLDDSDEQNVSASVTELIYELARLAQKVGCVLSVKSSQS